MAVGGVGGLVGNLFNPGLNDQLAQSLTPNANPLADQASKGNPATGAPGSPQQPQPNLPNPAVAGQDPVTGNLIAQLLRKQQLEANEQSLNEGLQGMAAGFGTAQQQHDKQAALGHSNGAGGGAGGLGGIGDMLNIQQAVTDQNEHARFMAGAGTLAQVLFPGDPDGVAKATEVMNNKGLLGQFGGTAAANATTTTTVKDADAATRAWADANPKATPADISNYKANLIAGGMGGSDLAQRQYLQEKSAGLTTDDYPTWQAKHQATADAMATQAKQAQEFKDSATQDYTPNNTKLTSIQSYIQTLKNNPAAAQQALSTMLPTTGPAATWMPGALVSDDEKAAANALQKIRSTLSADQLAGVKNVRNAREFNTLSQAATGGLNASASPADFAKAIDDIQNKFLDAQATNELAVGHKLTGNLVGHGNQDLTEPLTPSGQKNPYYNGGSQDNDFRKMSDVDANAAYERLPPGTRYVGPDGVGRTK